MRIYLVVLVSLFFVPVAKAEGSLDWVDVCQRLEKDCPKLLVTINQCFDVSPAGWALRLGPRSIDVIEGRLAVGTRVPPYKFDCKVKGTTGSYPLIIEISDWDDGWKFIIREKQLKKPAEPVGADQPATKPADKVPAKIQPSTPMSKDGPR